MDIRHLCTFAASKQKKIRMKQVDSIERSEQREPSELARRWPSREGLRQSQRTKQHFDDIAASYADSSDGKFCAPAYGALKREVEKFASGKWLDVSCGTGTVLSMLSDSSLKKYGVDFSEKMIEEACCNVGKDVNLYVASAEKMPFERDTFDVVTCSFAFHHYTQPEAVLQEFRRVMKPGATLIIADPYISQPFRAMMNPLLRFCDNGDYHMYGKKELTRLMKRNGFQMQDFQRINKRSFSCRCVAAN